MAFLFASLFILISLIWCHSAAERGRKPALLQAVSPAVRISAAQRGDRPAIPATDPGQPDPFTFQTDHGVELSERKDGLDNAKICKEQNRQLATIPKFTRKEIASWRQRQNLQGTKLPAGNNAKIYKERNCQLATTLKFTRNEIASW
ncbi:MAG: hypothetical protein IJR87_08460 [Bacteroidaceae bacterium]|nr:hypothetical protein [Bacteroidaceae bacterium]